MKKLAITTLLIAFTSLVGHVHAQTLADTARADTVRAPVVAHPDSVSASESPEMQEVQDVLTRFGRMWEDEDMETFEEIIAHDPEMVVIGTDTSEYIVGYEPFKKARKQQFESFENIEFNVQERAVQLAETGTVAWFTEVYDVFLMAQDQPVSLDDIRVSGVMEKRDGAWVIVHLHTSVPVRGQAAEY